jgi:hypothetical protein
MKANELIVHFASLGDFQEINYPIASASFKNRLSSLDKINFFAEI